MATEYEPLECTECEADLLETGLGNVLLVREKGDRDSVVDVYWACKDCSRAAQEAYRSSGCTTRDWTDVHSLLIPGQYVRWTIGIINDMHRGMRFSDQALRKLETVLFCVSQRVLRRQTKKEKEGLADLRYWDEVRPEGF